MSSDTETPEENERQKIHELVKGIEVSQRGQLAALQKLKEHVREQEKKKSAARKRAKSYVDLARELRQVSALREREIQNLENKLSEQSAQNLEIQKQDQKIKQELEEERDNIAKELEHTKKLLAHQTSLKIKVLTTNRTLQDDFGYVQKRLTQAESDRDRQKAQSFISMLDHPYPYRSVLAISSDIDDASFASVSLTHRCFYGLELGYEDVALELSNSFWMICSDTPKSSEVYLYDENLKPAAHHDQLLPFLKGSLFDTLHTYGQFGEGRRFTREAAEFCTEKLSAHDLNPEFWTYHGDRKQFQNGVPTDSAWRADDKDSPYYHFDLLKNTSLKYLRLPPSRRLDQIHPVIEKQIFRDDSVWFAVNSHSISVDEDTRQRTETWLDKLRELDRISYERRRIIQPSSSYPDKIQTWMPEMLPEQLSEARLNEIVEQGRHLLITQHLTKAFCTSAYGLDPVREALLRLSDYQKAEKILVTTPVRLINYERVREGLSQNMTILKSVKRLEVNIDSDCNLFGMETKITPDDLQGIGFKISKDLPSDYEIRLTLDKKAVPDFEVKDIEGTGERIIYIPWRSNLSAQRDMIKEWDKAFKPPS